MELNVIFQNITFNFREKEKKINFMTTSKAVYSISEAIVLTVV